VKTKRSKLVSRAAVAAATLALVLTCSLAALSAPAPAALAQAAPVRADARIKADVERQLAGLKLNPARVKVTVQDAVVTLSGLVDNVWLKRQAITRARKVEGVHSVVSDLSVRKAENDTTLAIQVGRQIRDSMFYTVFDEVEGSVREGVVFLEGRVTSPDKVARFEDDIARIWGVRDVVNTLQALPASQSDDDIRWAIAIGIYGDLFFQDAATQKYPPIHIIVERGHVTLTGFVRSTVERTKAEAAARSAFGVFSVTNKLRTNDR